MTRLTSLTTQVFNGTSVAADFRRRFVQPTSLTTLGNGQVLFTTVGNISWTVPANVYAIHAVAVGGGEGSSAIGFIPSYGGGGGSLSYSNNIPVTPGEVLTVQVGFGGTGSSTTLGQIGGASAIYRQGTPLLLAAGGDAVASNTGTQINVNVGQVKNFGGGRPSNAKYYAAGGAAGYSGRGGNARPISSGSGGGAGASYGDGGSTINQAGAGGVGLRGEGTSGTAGTISDQTGKGGSYGANGSPSSGQIGGNGGNYGGGGGGGELGAGNGAPGGIRIIWGATRSFPLTLTGDLFTKLDGHWTSTSTLQNGAYLVFQGASADFVSIIENIFDTNATQRSPIIDGYSPAIQYNWSFGGGFNFMYIILPGDIANYYPQITNVANISTIYFT